MYKSQAGRFTRAVAFAAAAALAAGAVVPAAAQATDTQTSSTDAKADKSSRKFCIRMEATGSRMAKKVCKTRADWIKQDGYDPTTD